MFQNILEKFKNPVTTIIEYSENENDIKKCTIKLVILSAIVSLINVITKIISIFIYYSKRSYYTSEDKWKAIKDAELLSGFFKMWVIIAISMAVVALILFIISKLVKSPKEYVCYLSMVNNVFIIYMIGFVLETIMSFLYTPLSVVLLFATNVYSVFTLLCAYRDSLDIADSNMLVLATTGVLSVLLVIGIVIIAGVSGANISELDSITDLFIFY